MTPLSNFENQFSKNAWENLLQVMRMLEPVLQDKFPTTGTPVNRPLHSCTGGCSHSPKN
jgi:hypothetical protein